MTETRKALIRDVVPEYAVGQGPEPLDLRMVFPGLRTVVDFGAGMGAHAIELAEAGLGVLAVDVHSPGICAVVAHAHAAGLTNVRVHMDDGVALLADRLARGCVDELHILFPDPWPKARHHKRRLITGSFLAVAHRVLAPGGRLVIVSDDAGYTDHIREVVAHTSIFTADDALFDYRPTGYHERAIRLGNTISVFTLIAA